MGRRGRWFESSYAAPLDSHQRLTYAGAMESFWHKVQKGDGTGCWLWTGSQHRKGYGQIRIGGILLGAHIVSYTMAHGEIPAGLEIDHLCKVPACVRPDHLEVVTKRINALRGDSVSGVNARKVRCNSDHPLSGSNLIVIFSKKGWPHRRCHICRDGRRSELTASFKERGRQPKPSVVQLKEDLETLNWCAVGRKYGVTDSAVKKWAKSYGLV